MRLEPRREEARPQPRSADEQKDEARDLEEAALAGPGHQPLGIESREEQPGDDDGHDQAREVAQRHDPGRRPPARGGEAVVDPAHQPAAHDQRDGEAPEQEERVERQPAQRDALVDRIAEAVLQRTAIVEKLRADLLHRGVPHRRTERGRAAAHQLGREAGPHEAVDLGDLPVGALEPVLGLEHRGHGVGKLLVQLLPAGRGLRRLGHAFRRRRAEGVDPPLHLVERRLQLLLLRLGVVALGDEPLPHHLELGRRGVGIGDQLVDRGRGGIVRRRLRLAVLAEDRPGQDEEREERQRPQHRRKGPCFSSSRHGEGRSPTARASRGRAGSSSAGSPG